MLRRLLVLMLALGVSATAHAQLGGLGGALRGAQRALDAKKAFDDLTFTADEEHTIGEAVSQRVRARFGVVQDPAVHRYVTLVGLSLARQSSRPSLPWTFIVLDTDGVNAFASPGGFVHITRGALGLIHNEAELAGVLGHEVGHVAQQHTINALRKDKARSLVTQAVARSEFLEAVGNRIYADVIENAYDRGDELDADRFGVELPAKVGYAPAALGAFLTRLEARNGAQAERNGLFASHPETKERIEKVAALAKGRQGTAEGQPRYAAEIHYEPTPLTSIAVVVEGAAGLAGGSEKDAAPKKKGFGLGTLKAAVSPEKQSAQVSASGGARGVGPDRAAKGGPNPALVAVSVTDADLAAFRAGIA